MKAEVCGSGSTRLIPLVHSLQRATERGGGEKACSPREKRNMFFTASVNDKENIKARDLAEGSPHMLGHYLS